MVGDEFRLRKYLKISITLIVILLLVIVYFLIAKPQIDGYVVKKQVDAMDQTVSLIIQAVNQNGWVQLGEGENAILLCRFNPETGACVVPS